MRLHDSPATDTTKSGIAGPILTIGFAAAVAMWAIGYIAHLPGLHTPPAVVFPLLVAAMLLAGAGAVRVGVTNLRTIAAAGALTGAINLLIVGSLLGGKQRDALLPAELARVALIWTAATIALSSVCVTIGAALARSSIASPASGAQPANWPFRFALVAAVATLFLLSVGGVVTGFAAGLAVPDWPNTYGYNMFLFPLSKMTGGIYFEHSHRLFGALVGLTTLTLTIYLAVVERRKWLIGMAFALLLVVIVQGLLGALRVTGKFTLSQNAAELAPNLTLAAVHGVLAQIFFSGLLCLAAFLSSAWRTAPPHAAHDRAAFDRPLATACVLLTLAQIIFGALLRHFSWGLHLHLTLATLVFFASGAFAIRTWSLYDDQPPLPRLGATLITLLGLQLLLGFAALAATTLDNPQSGPHPAQVIITTIHQTTGAVLLATTVLTAVWHFRLVRPVAADSPDPSHASAAR
jgi:cytochrome c oxidase assembly protein subunit 15